MTNRPIAVAEWGRRACSALLIVTLLTSLVASAGCARWEQVPVAGVEDCESDLVGKKVRVTTPAGTVNVLVSEVAYPWLIGNDYTDGFFPKVRVDLNEVTRIETEHPEAELGNWLLVGAGALLVVSIAVVAIAGGSELAK